MNLDRNRLKEPGLGRVLLGVLALGCAIVLGFVLGLKAGDRGRMQPQAPIAEIVTVPDSTTAVADTLMQADSLQAVEPPVEIPEEPAFSKQQIAQGVEYLASHNRWNRDEMEKIPVLVGLWDAINLYAVDDIHRYNEWLASTPLSSIEEGLEKNPKQGYYAAKGDKIITLSTYIKRLR